MGLALGGTAALGNDKKKLGIMAGLVGVLLVVLVIRFVLPGGEASDSARAGDGVSHGGKSLLDTQPGYLDAIARVARLRSEKSYDAEESRDPMEPLIKERTPRVPQANTTQEIAASTELPRMSLHGIIWDEESPIVIIDGLDLRVGDTIKGARVAEIGYNQVVLTYRSRRHVLTVD